MRYCVKCGCEIEDGFMFCPECGTKAVATAPNNAESLFEKVRVLLNSGKEKEAFDLAKTGFKKNDTECTRALGIMYKYGLGTEVDLEKSFELLSLPELSDNAKACAELSDFYLNGDVVEKDVKKAIELLEKSLSLGADVADYKLGLIYGFYGDDEKNIDKAKKHLKNALQRNYRLGMVNFYLAMLYKNEKNNDLALGYAKKAEEIFAESDDELHIKVLFFIFELIFPAYAEAVFSNANAPESLENDVRIYAFKGAEKNIPNLQDFLAEVYRTGIYFAEKDPEKYIYWLKKAAENGFAAAQYELALLYMPGNNNEYSGLVEQNGDTCIAWLTKAAQQKNEGAVRMANIHLKCLRCKKLQTHFLK